MHDFEWDEHKARLNLVKHSISFDTAKLVFLDTFAVEQPMEVAVNGEARYTLIGMAQLAMIAVIYAERKGRVRIISARHATKFEERLYALENRSDW